MTELLKCPFCGGEAKLKEFYESCDGRGDKYPRIICCKCDVEMILTTNEFYGLQDKYNYTGGYYSQNKAFWKGMHQYLIDKWNTRKPVQDVLKRLEEVGGLKVKVIGGRCNGKTLQLGYQKGIQNAVEIVKEGLK